MLASLNSWSLLLLPGAWRWGEAHPLHRACRGASSGIPQPHPYSLSPRAWPSAGNWALARVLQKAVDTAVGQPCSSGPSCGWGLGVVPTLEVLEGFLGKV